MKGFRIWLLGMMMACLCTQGRGEGRPPIDSLLQMIIHDKGASGIAAAVIQNGKTTFYMHGTLSKDGQAKVNALSTFEVGSVTKLFTALSLARAVGEGKLQYNTTIGSLIPGLPDSVGSITLLQLATHTSGLPRLPANLHWHSPRNRQDPYARYTQTELWQSLRERMEMGKPGTKYDYSNYGYAVLANIVMSADGYKNCNDLYQASIYAPLHLSNTFIDDTSHSTNQAAGYSEKGEPLKNWHFQSMAGAGAIRSDMEDMALFLKAFMYPDSVSDKLLSKAIKDTKQPRFTADNNLRIGLGWHMSPFDDDVLYWHNGGTGSFSSFVGFLEKEKKGVVILTNSPTRAVDDIAIEILKEIVYGPRKD